ncbi:MAG: replication-associated recombination protein A, partial [Chloroflexi bacterium]
MSVKQDLFDFSRQEQLKTRAPLAARMRPRTLDEFVGQEDIVGPGKLLRRAIEADKLFSSIILWGPPGTGKTTLAVVIANHTQSHFATISAVMSGVADIRALVKEAQDRLGMFGQRTIVLVDEIHRWNKA